MKVLPVVAAATTVIGAAILVTGFQAAETAYRQYERRRCPVRPGESLSVSDGLRVLALSSHVMS